MAQSTTLRRFRKLHPELESLPRNFPLTAHPTGRWCKKIQGKIVYFGEIRAWEDALKEYHRVLPEVKKGRVPATRATARAKGQLTLADLCNRYLEYQNGQVAAGELTQRSWDEYCRVCEIAVGTLGRKFPVVNLTTDEYLKIRDRLSRGKTKQLSATTWANLLQRMRAVFNFGLRNGLLPEANRPGDGLKRPKARTIRKQRLDKQVKKGKLLYSPQEISTLCEHATPQVKAMLLLGLNAALGNTDLGRMRFPHLDLDGLWLTFPREKTGMPREAALWPQTVEAIRDYLSRRIVPKDDALRDRVFITRYGGTWLRDKGPSTALSHEFSKLAKKAGVVDRGFYSLRRTFQTTAENLTGDIVAIKVVMGHVPSANDMSAVYRQEVSRDRLRRVADAVGKWLFGGAT